MPIIVGASIPCDCHRRAVLTVSSDLKMDSKSAVTSINKTIFCANAAGIAVTLSELDHPVWNDSNVWHFVADQGAITLKTTAERAFTDSTITKTISKGQSLTIQPFHAGGKDYFLTF